METKKEETGKNTCLNVLKGFMAASLVTVVPQRLYAFCVAISAKIKNMNR